MLFGKYRLLRELGRGQSGTVYLAEHAGLSAHRAVKAIARDSEHYDAFMKEALLLKSLCHIGIPTIYDIGEDDSYAYIIEEYLEGESLASLLYRVGKLPCCQVLQYGIQLCNIISYLHSLEFPIIHLDVQPNNIYLCKDSLKLLDFGNAVYLSDTGYEKVRYGTPDFAAPEQYTGGMLSQATDIYAIGVILHFMAAGCVPKNKAAWSSRLMMPKLGQIIGCCLQKEQKKRFGSAEELKEQLSALLELPETGRAIQNTSLVVTVLGTRPGAGATHFALGFCCYLNHAGIPCLYEERNTGRTVWEMAANDGAVKQIGTLYYKEGNAMRPFYGYGVEEAPDGFCVRLIDCGCPESALDLPLQEADWILVVSGSNSWEQTDAQVLKGRLNQKPSVLWLYNHCDRTAARRLARNHKDGQTAFLPYFPNPFHQGKEIRQWYERLFAVLVQSDTLGRMGRWAFFRERWRKFLPVKQKP